MALNKKDVYLDFTTKDLVTILCTQYDKDSRTYTIHFLDDGKPFLINKTNRKVMFKMTKKDNKKVLDLSMEAGRILLDAGAEIFRVEETIERISRAFGIEKCSPFVMSTGIFLTAENEEGEIYASVKHIPIQGAKLYRVAAVNQLSREIVEGKYTLEEAEERLEIIKNMPGKRPLVRILSAGLGSGSFCYLLGGKFTDMFAAFLSGVLLYAILVLIDLSLIHI